MKNLSTLLIGLVFMGCSTMQRQNMDSVEAPENPVVVNIENAPKPSPEKDLNDNETDMQRLPAELNDKVTMWIEYFQGRGREHMSRYLSRSSRYLPKMKEILNSHGLPEDLVYIALIESGFNSKALSRANAVGYWQFIRGTGRRYGLQQNYYIDQRRDFILSTEAAAKYLKALYSVFGSWYLAIASYNVGENRIKNLVMKYYTRDFWELSQKGRLPKETQNYVPKFLAARMIAKHPEKYGFDDVVYEPPLDFKEVVISNTGVNLKKMSMNLGVSFKELAGLNPAYKREVIPKREGDFNIRVPSQLEDKIIMAALEKSQSKITMSVVANGDGETYRIRRGDTLSHIAQRFGTSIKAIRAANNFSRRDVLYPGKKIIVPTGRRISTPESQARSVKVNGGEKKYVVRSGDNLYTISKKFGVRLSEIKKRNNLGSRSLLNIGKVLVIPSTGNSTRNTASIASGVFHVVKSGDTLTDIARRYNTTIAALAKVNKMSNRARLAIGKKLLIP